MTARDGFSNRAHYIVHNNDDAMGTTILLKAENISKSYHGVKALDNVQLQVKKGEVHALMGENGAGKSTLMKILIGMLQPDAGTVYFKDQQVQFHSVHDAIKAGFSMIHQELLPFPELTVAENIFMGKEPVYFSGWINRKKMQADAGLILNKLGVTIKANRKMKNLSIAEMQMVEIAKAISNKADIIIMDEPTSAISGKEVDTLFKVIKELTQQGVAIIYISHKMNEILEVSDSVTVMRDGKYIATRTAKELNNQELIQMIVGRELNTIFEKRNSTAGEIFMEVESLSGPGFKDIHFNVRRGEVLGIAGLMGAGRTEIVETIFGLHKKASGTIRINGVAVDISSPGYAIKRGVGLISEDRKRTGLVLSASVKNNITLASLKRHTSGTWIVPAREAKVADTAIRDFNIKTSSRYQLVNNLSGGNQQKVVLAKVLLNQPELIIFDEPTRGIDIGAKAEIYKMIARLASEGKAIIVISSELPEILGLSDRVLVVRNGRITAELDGATATQEEIMQHAME